jgi:hypothetical protein
MLHDGADGSNRFLECSAERGFLPAAGVPLHTEAIEVGAQACKSNTIIVLSGLIRADWLRSTGNQMITARANAHAGGELVGLKKLDELGLSGTHRVVHGLSLPGAGPGRSSGRGEPRCRSTAR